MSDIKVTQQHIDELLKKSELHIETVFGKVTIVTVKLPNGYTLTESSGCVDPANYDKEYGAKLCMKQIEHRLWQLEGYVLQNRANSKKTNHALTLLNNTSGTVDFGKETHSYLKFQQGVEPKYGVNGVQVDEVIRALLTRMNYLNERKHDMYNDQTIAYLEKAYDAQLQRTLDRKARNVEGTEKD